MRGGLSSEAYIFLAKIRYFNATQLKILRVDI